MAEILNTIAKIKKSYAATNPEGPWFDRETSLFFRSEFSDLVAGNEKEAWFISSEQFMGGEPRLYTVRYYRVGKCPKTVGVFQGYKTEDEACAAIIALVVEHNANKRNEWAGF